MPVSAVLVGFVDLIVSILVFGLLMIYYRVLPAWNIIFLPVFILMLLMALFGIGLWLAALNVKYRDVRYALPFAINILMYVTPVIYPVTMLNGHPWAKTAMLWLNPMSGVISNARAGLLGHSPFQWDVLGIALVVSTIYFIIGLYYFRSTERYFADIA